MPVTSVLGRRERPDPQKRVLRIGDDDLRRVVVDTEKIGRRGDRAQVFGRRQGEPPSVVLEHVGRVAAAVQRIEKPAIEVAVEATRGCAVGRLLAARLDDRRIERDADRGVGHARAQRLDRLAVREQQRVRGCQRKRRIAFARRVVARLIAEKRAAPRLVERDPVPHPITQAPPDRRRRSRQRRRRARDSASRPDPPASAAGPSGTASATARYRPPAVRRPAARTSPGRPC